MATSTTRSRFVRAVVPFVAVGALLAGLMSTAGPATADPHLTIAQVQARLNALELDAESASELLNNAQLKLAAINVKIAALKLKVAAAQAQLGRTTKAVNSIAVTAWTSGGTDGMLQAMLSSNPQQFLERASTLDVIANSETAELRRTQSARLALAQAQAELAQQQTAAAAATEDAAHQQSVINDKVVATKSLLGSLQEVERQRLAALAEAQRQASIKAAKAAAAAARAQAAAAAKLAAKSSSSGGNSSSGNSPSYTGDGSYSSRARIAVAEALSHVGERYSYNANPPNSWDCSKLTAYAWAKAGVYLDAYSYAQWGETRRISRSDLQPGDLLFYFNNGAHHVEMYIGGGRAVSASNPGVGVEIQDNPFGGWYGDHYSGAGRVL